MACCVLDRLRVAPVTPTETTTGLENHAVCIGTSTMLRMERAWPREVSYQPITVA